MSERIRHALCRMAAGSRSPNPRWTVPAPLFVEEAHGPLARVLLRLLAMAAVHAAKKPYGCFRIGNSTDVAPMPAPGVVLMDGSTDVDAAFQVATLVIPDNAATTNAMVAEILSKAEAVWITGGDPSN